MLFSLLLLSFYSSFFLPFVFGIKVTSKEEGIARRIPATQVFERGRGVLL